MKKKDDHVGITVLILLGLVVFVVVVIGLFVGMPKYRIWQREMHGRAELAEAEWTKKVAIEEAKAKQESAQYEAGAEIERAKGAAEAQKIISATLTPEYLQYLYIQQIEKGENRQTIYIPTEAGLPLTEAGQRE